MWSRNISPSAEHTRPSTVYLLLASTDIFFSEESINQRFVKTYCKIRKYFVQFIQYLNVISTYVFFYLLQDITKYESKIPYLLTASGRQESAVEKIFEHLKSNPIDPEEIAMFHNIHKARVSKHLARGFTVISK